jgi:SAM-dependent methyltransferase
MRLPSMIPTDYSFKRYLAAKKSVDDRALNRHVWESLVRSLPATTSAAPLRVLEVGAGIGTMIERLLDWEALTHAAYTAIDADAVNIDAAHRRLPSWALRRGFNVERVGERLHLRRGGRDVILELEGVDLLDFAERERGRRAWDLLIAHAFMDLVDVPSTLPDLFSLLRPNGLFYFTIVFDGVTTFQPEVEPAFDARIAALYHQTMDQRVTAGKPSGDSQAGRHLLNYLRAVQAELLDVGASDWVVLAGPDGYPADEAYFLHHIIHILHTALEGHPDLDAAQFADWIAQRHNQVEAKTLAYIAHQLDYLGRVPEPEAKS